MALSSQDDPFHRMGLSINNSDTIVEKPGYKSLDKYTPRSRSSDIFSCKTSPIL